jgi:thiosulfate/3-mercaptopyruvate sulfurtransferase
MNNHLIEAVELQRSLAIFRIVDCRFSLSDSSLGQQQYQQGHIPGAVYLHLENDLSGKKKNHGCRHPLPDITSFSRTLANAGITKSTPVVVYDNNKLAYACRAWWLLKSAGIETVRVLNGGYYAWLLDGREQEKGKPLPDEYNATCGLVRWQPPIFRYSDVVAAIDKHQITLIDSREPIRYRGEQEPIDPVAGHIPTAINKPWTDITDANGFVKNDNFHNERWADVPPEKPLVVYCGSGVTATVNIFSAFLSGREATLYAGSWSDWCSQPEAEIVVE